MVILARIIFLVFICLQCACTHTSYLLQAGVGQWSLYNHERPIEEVIQDPRTSSEVREKLMWVGEIKKFVENELNIQATSNYRTYVDLHRPYVIWAVTAAEQYELKTKEWWFPIIGHVPYLGYFKEQDAKAWQEQLSGQGYDTYVRGVSAYSTLGYLRDPMLSSMLNQSKSEMVNLIFHESTHGEIYVSGHGSFNEQVASFIGDYGERLWILKNYGNNSTEFTQWQKDRQKRREFGVLLRGVAKDLEDFYKKIQNLSDVDKQKEKERKFTEIQSQIAHRFHARFAQMLTNNAVLLAFLTYEDNQEKFDLLFQKCNQNLKKSFEALKKISKIVDSEKKWECLQ